MLRLKPHVKRFGVSVMIALLLWLPWVPVVSQQAGSLPSRSQIVTGLNQAFATLAAAGGVLWNFEASVLLSTPQFTGAFVPLSKEDFERSEEILANMLRGKPGSAPLGALYVSEAVKLQVAGEDPISLYPGSYRLVAVTANRAELIDGEGNVKGSLPIKVMQVANTTPTKFSPEVRTYQNAFEVEVGPIASRRALSSSSYLS